ncbi:hypothetical protein UFOVP1666_143 [uncultured Caudovirales phage]|uniref:Uncharacterized protein n=1 Tax=uncultured Caudovirales phage TaxID=2100421 RepID=A0A6J5PFU0_9CAUD|nr:hypothetical protein UFOVP867_98 [uncultured Caudovirales phage]CAB4170749.1 hypothetical protein UFOVP913_100 [uncultured Caudovirales phage]CAB4177064.1 hypothetical protein UFOVP993_153 [uncultured Caudovirales phage]CAB4223142.1 hypothetical protein UFOVP1666_143 [uncultured Caudovirales phage]
MNPESEEFVEMVDNIDEMLVDACVKYKLPPLLLASVVLARLMLLNQNSENFKNLVLAMASANTDIRSNHVVH